jgi:hypothetical protein
MIKLEKRSTVNSKTAVLVGVIAVLLGLIVSIVILTMLGYDALEIYRSAFGATFFKRNGIMEVMVTWIPRCWIVCKCPPHIKVNFDVCGRSGSVWDSRDYNNIT